MTSQQADASLLTDKASDLAFLDNIDELNTAWPDYQDFQNATEDVFGAPGRVGSEAGEQGPPPPAVTYNRASWV
eukprot:gene6064-6302_t